MSDRNINYFREFLYSKQNAILAGCTLGVGLLSAHPFVFILGVVGYGLGLMFLHDSPWFRKKVDSKYDEIDKLANYKQVEEFKAKRARTLDALSQTRKDKYLDLVKVGRAIESATSDVNSDSDNPMDSRLRKIDELIYTFLKLLTIEQTLEVFIESERQDDLPKEMKDVQNRLDTVMAEIAKFKESAAAIDASKDAAAAANANNIVAAKERLMNSYAERKDVLTKRIANVEKAKANIEIVNAEQERLQQQVKLIRADAIATRNTDALTSRIDASVVHLGETNKLLEEMNEFKDVVGDMPESLTSRVGFGEDSCVSYKQNIIDNNLDVAVGRTVKIKRPSERHMNRPL